MNVNELNFSRDLQAYHYHNDKLENSVEKRVTEAGQSCIQNSHTNDCLLQLTFRIIKNGIILPSIDSYLKKIHEELSPNKALKNGISPAFIDYYIKRIRNNSRLNSLNNKMLSMRAQKIKGNSTEELLSTLTESDELWFEGNKRIKGAKDIGKRLEKYFKKKYTSKKKSLQPKSSQKNL